MPILTDKLDTQDAPGATAEEPIQGVATETSAKTFIPSGWRDLLFHAVSFHVVLALIVVTVLFALCRDGVSDPDIWWHLHNAGYLVAHHTLPSADHYSFTVAGHPWINHEWLAELPFYFAWRAAGLSGINAVTFATLALIFFGVLYLCWRETNHYKASIVAACFGLFLGSVSFGPRTILFGYVELVLLLILLQRFRRKGGAALAWFPLLFCLWVNTHGSWLIGLVIFSMIIAAGWVRIEWGLLASTPWTSAQRKTLLAGWVASVLALFINPVGARLVFYPFDLAFRQKLNIAHIAEWVSVDFHDLRGKIVFVLLIVFLLSGWLRPRRWTLAEAAVLLFALYSGLTHVRFLFLLGIVAAPMLAKIFDFVPPYRREMDTPIVNAVVITLIIAAIVHYWPRERTLEAMVARQYPVQAMDYLQAHPTDGPMLNFYLWGGYVNWRNPGTRIFVDSRVDIFEYAGVFKDYLDLLALERPDRVLAQYKIRYVLFPLNEPLTYALEHDPEWRILYQDQLCVLLARTAPASSAESQKSEPLPQTAAPHDGGS